MRLLDVLILIFFISVIGIIIGFITRKKLVKIIFIVVLVVEIISITLLIVWLATL